MRMIILLMALAACGGPAPVADPVGSASCGADKVQDLIGQPMGGLRGRFAETTRIIPPGTAVTQDYSPSRMNVDLDANDAIARIWCG